MEFQPGEYTIQYMFDQRNVGQINKLRTAQTIAYALRSLGELAPPPPQPTDVEVINNPVNFDTVSGVVRIRFRRSVSYEEFGLVVLETARGNGFPDAVPHSAASQSLPLGSGLLARAGNWLGREIRSVVTGEESPGPVADVVAGVTPGISAVTRPLLGSSPVEALNTGVGLSTRQSEDPARNGSVAVSEAANAARGAIDTGAAALQIPTWLYIAGGVAAGVLVIALAAGVYQRVGGK